QAGLGLLDVVEGKAGPLSGGKDPLDRKAIRAFGTSAWRTAAPIRRKKSSALSTGTPESCWLTRQGDPTHVHRPGLSQRGECRPLLALRFPANRRRFALCLPSGWLYSLGLGKRSPALQACNQTRNTQADGAPLVHHP